MVPYLLDSDGTYVGTSCYDPMAEVPITITAQDPFSLLRRGLLVAVAVAVAHVLVLS
jgi:hypothetical protein